MKACGILTCEGCGRHLFVFSPDDRELSDSLVTSGVIPGDRCLIGESDTITCPHCRRMAPLPSLELLDAERLPFTARPEHPSSVYLLMVVLKLFEALWDYWLQLEKDKQAEAQSASQPSGE